MARKAQGAGDATAQAAAAYLRAQFFARRLREFGFFDVTAEVQKLLAAAASFPWDACESFGVASQAMHNVRAAGVEPLLFFLHPRVLEEQPSLLLYYRCVALLSQKGLQAVAGTGVAGIESRKVSRVTPVTAERIVRAVNEVLSQLAETVKPFDRRYVEIFLYATAGSQIQGSWVNAIGRQGELVVRELVVRNLWDEITQVVWRNDTSSERDAVGQERLLQDAGRIKVLRLKHGFHCVFASEPDMSFRDVQGKPLLALEVKAGTDPAGALERYGAAIKSFQNERAMNPRVKTVYVTSCLTPEVRKRIAEESPFDYTYLVSDLLRDKASQQKLAGLMVRHLVQSERGH